MLNTRSTNRPTILSVNRSVGKLIAVTMTMIVYFMCSALVSSLALLSTKTTVGYYILITTCGTTMSLQIAHQIGCASWMPTGYILWIVLVLAHLIIYLDRIDLNHRDTTMANYTTLVHIGATGAMCWVCR